MDPALVEQFRAAGSGELPLQVQLPLDPVTAALLLGTEVVKLIEKILDGMPAEVKAEYAKLALEDLRAWRAFLDKLTGK